MQSTQHVFSSTAELALLNNHIIFVSNFRHFFFDGGGGGGGGGMVSQSCYQNYILSTMEHLTRLSKPTCHKDPPASDKIII